MIYYKYKIELETHHIIEEECVYDDDKLKFLDVEKQIFVNYNTWPDRYFYAEGLSREMCIDMIKEKAKSLFEDSQLALKLIGEL